jgi:ABC-2 type transport system permease protein
MVAMRAELLARALLDRRRAMVWWALGIAAYIGLIVAFWPSIRDSPDLQKSVEDLPESLKAFFGGEESFDFSTAAGFLQSRVYSLILPLLLGIFAIGFAAGTLAGEEERGQVDLVLSHPVSRSRVVLEKALAVAAGLVALGLASWLAVLALGEIVDLGVSAGRLLAASTGAVLLSLFNCAAALLAGAVSGRRGTAIAGGAVVFAAGYLLSVLAELSSSLSFTEDISPYHHGVGVDPVRNGWPPGSFALLVALAGVATVLAVWAFGRRDVNAR